MSDPFMELLREMGLGRRGDPLLAQPARRFELPAEQEQAAMVLADLVTALDQICAARPFPKGSGIAAPQLGRPVAAAIVRPRGMADIALLNPCVVDHSDEIDVQWEGCLSCFQLRGRVSRSRAITVRWAMPDGQTVERRFTDGAARMVAHECDHLEGVLYLDRLVEGTQPIGIEEYTDGHRPWLYRPRSTSTTSVTEPLK
ncbi:peptide deformylase [Nonomuraea sp. K274]|uniref:Peptide deformylase n=1 Tax=Nonomuraea cypriaca TaxID=1187855 RepID=A0A931EZL4_9ACTN|nr:peptide deformylase [Nonomuraea cypriaca]MBF8185318.1 peptide deformylase [Nonomuraea cypriaca]